MKSKQVILAVVVAFAWCLLTPALAQHSASARTGIQGTISGSDGEPARFTVVLEQGGKKLPEILTDEKGHFEIPTEPGTYTAYVKPTTDIRYRRTLDKRIKHAPFLVEAGGMTKVELDPAYEYVYCTSTGDRVIPVSLRDEKTNSRLGLRRPGYDWVPVRLPDGSYLDGVIQYCGKKPKRQPIEYKTAIVEQNANRLFADNFLFDPQSGFLSGMGRVDILMHGKSIDQPSSVVANFTGGKAFLNWSGKATPSMSGEGTIKAGKFDFSINPTGNIRFTYQDAKRNWKLMSRDHDCLFIAKITKEGVTFGGSAVVTSGDPNRRKVVDFTVVVKDDNQESGDDNGFSISIPTLDYHAKGRLTSGTIDIKDRPKGIAKNWRH
jgi:hypothetical protein